MHDVRTRRSSLFSEGRRRLVLAVATVVLALAGLVVGIGFPQQAQAVDPRRPLNVLLLGDSYSAGNGSRDRSGDRTYFGAEGCYRSTTNWASQYVAWLGGGTGAGRSASRTSLAA